MIIETLKTKLQLIQYTSSFAKPFLSLQRERQGCKLRHTRLKNILNAVNLKCPIHIVAGINCVS